MTSRALPPLHLLVVDDNPVDRMALRRLLGPPITVHEVETAAAARARAAQVDPDLILLDYRLPDNDGLDLLADLAEDHVVVLLTGQDDSTLAVEAVRSGAMDYLAKDRITGARLRQVLLGALRRAELEREVGARRAAARARQVELEQAFRDLERERRRLNTLLDTLPTSIAVVDPAGRLRWTGGRALSEAVQTALRIDLEDSLTDTGPADGGIAGCARFLRRALDGHGGGRIEFVWRDRTLLAVVEPATADLGSDEAILLLHDLSEVRTLEASLTRAQRLESVGLHTATIAHDFRNLLMAIGSGARLLAEDHTGDESPPELALILDACDRADDLCRSLLAFARRPAAATSTCRPFAVTRGVAPLLRHLLPSRIALELTLPDTPGPATPMPGRDLEQVLVNLATNAAAAMPDGGRITIAGHMGDDHARISVRDDGCGIPEHLHRRIFEPLFTTRGDRGGTGLGLFTVRRLLERAGGGLSLESQVDRGTTFTLTLPLHPEVPR